MGRFVKGDVVVTLFPYSDMSGAKRRPALVLADLAGDDAILCQITSQDISDPYSVPVTPQDFDIGGLRRAGNIRPNRLFTSDTPTVLYVAGHLSNSKVAEVLGVLFGILADGDSDTQP